MNEPNQLPCARMMTISKPSFWIYFMACAMLFAWCLFKPHEAVSGWLVPTMIALSIFVVLFLELLSQRVQNGKAAALLANACYILEAGSVLFFVFIVFGK